jgi:hypothetical protein
MMYFRSTFNTILRILLLGENTLRLFNDAVSIEAYIVNDRMISELVGIWKEEVNLR